MDYSIRSLADREKGGKSRSTREFYKIAPLIATILR